MAVSIYGHQMVKTYSFKFIKGARLYIMYGLVFFLWAACKNHSPKKVVLDWNKGVPTGILIPKPLLTDNTTANLKVVLATGSNTSILGNFINGDDAMKFEPLIPLTPGLGYNVFENNKLIGNVTVPVDKLEKPPQVTAIYPQADTLPENALKIYIQFSKPMRTGNVLDYIALLDGKDTLHNVFLNLQPELWDTTGKVLTLWLDPGRIKRGLVLNRELGNPLKTKDKYTLVISPEWKDSKGIKLLKSYTKTFVAGYRDNQIPDINTWRFNLPQAKSSSTLMIDLSGALDHFLLIDCITVLDAKGNPVSGYVSVGNNDREWQFSPSGPWVAQHYTLRVNAKLEDMAGNNLNRVFDRDITKEVKKDNVYYYRGFDIKP